MKVAAAYIRVSTEDQIEFSPDSQLEKIKLYAERNRIILPKEFIFLDDGYRGSNFDRPGFSELLNSIKEKKVNCVIVKDLSRFSRDYIGSGMYVMNLFPKWGIRVIAINDNYDSVNPLTANDELMLSFKSIINDVYLRDISTKIRSHLAVKRKNGEYIGPFVVYGLSKSPDDRHKLIIDEDVSEVIRKIFSLKMDGMSPVAIADKLNDLSIPSPSEYKKITGSKHCGFNSKGGKAKWTGQAVKRILQNPIYMGTLVQGKKTTISHKVKKLLKETNRIGVSPRRLSRQSFQKRYLMLFRICLAGIPAALPDKLIQTSFRVCCFVPTVKTQW